MDNIKKKHYQLYVLLVLSIIFIPAAYVFVAAVFVVQIISKELNTLRYIKSNKLLVIVVAYIAVGVLFSKYILISSLYGIMMFLCVYSVGLSAVNIGKVDFIHIRKLIYLVSIIVFIIGIVQYLNPDFVIPQKWVDGEEFKLKKRIFSTFYNPNVFGFYINIILIITCGNISIKKRNITEKTVFILGVICLFLTFSRTAWLSLVISLIISGFLFDKKYFRFAIVITLVIIGFDRVLNIGRSDPGRVLEDSSMLYRLEIWKACFKIIKDNIITGIGFGTLYRHIITYSEIVKSNIEHCHNVYIQILTETGLVGFGGFVLIVFNLIGSSWSRARSRKDQSSVTYFIVIMMVMIHGTVDSVLLTPQIMLVMSIFTGIILGKERSIGVPKGYKNFSFITFQ